MTLNEIFAYLFDFADILSSTVDKATNTITAQLGDVTKDRADSDNAEMWWGAPGIVGRPAAPTQGAASCQALTLKRGDRDVIVAYRDLRCSSIYGNLPPGSTAVFATSGEARTICYADGSIQSITSIGNAPGGTTFIVKQGADGSFTIAAPNWIFNGDATGKISLGNEACGLTMDPATGTVRIFGKVVQAQASGVAMFSGDVKTIVGPATSIVPGIGCLFGILSPGGSAAAPAASSTNVTIAP